MQPGGKSLGPWHQIEPVITNNQEKLTLLKHQLSTQTVKADVEHRRHPDPRVTELATNFGPSARLTRAGFLSELQALSSAVSARPQAWGRGGSVTPPALKQTRALRGTSAAGPACPTLTNISPARREAAADRAQGSS